MRYCSPAFLAALVFAACGGGSQEPSSAAGGAASATVSSGSESAPSASSDESAGGADDVQEFQLQDSKTAGDARGATPSKIESTATEAAIKFVVIDREDQKPIAGIVIALSAGEQTYYTEATDETGYAEVLVPIAKTYEITYLSLARKDIRAKVTVQNKPKQNIKLTLRFKRRSKGEHGVFQLDGVQFRTGSADLLPESSSRLDTVAEFMTYTKGARIEISGHTDNQGSSKTNKKLSQKRAQACRDYLIKKGIDGSRIKAVGRGDEQPIAPNDTEEGRQKNRRIEVREI